MAGSCAIPVRRVSALPAASFRFHLAANPLAVRLTVPPVRPVKDFHLQLNAFFRAHKLKPRHNLTTMAWLRKRLNYLFLLCRSFLLCRRFLGRWGLFHRFLCFASTCCHCLFLLCLVSNGVYIVACSISKHNMQTSLFSKREIRGNRRNKESHERALGGLYSIWCPQCENRT